MWVRVPSGWYRIMSERDLSQRLMTLLKQYGDAQRVENLATDGMPDVNYCIQGTEGWIENKWLHALPRHPSVVVRVPKFRASQRRWLLTRCSKAHGRAYVLLMIGNGAEYFLLEGAWAARALGRSATTLDLRRVALFTGAALPGPGLVGVLTR